MNVDHPQTGQTGAAAASITSTSSSNCVPNSSSTHASSIPAVGSSNGGATLFATVWMFRYLLLSFDFFL